MICKEKKWNQVESPQKREREKKVKETEEKWETRKKQEQEEQIKNGKNIVDINPAIPIII